MFFYLRHSGKIINSGKELFLGNNGNALISYTLVCLAKGKYT